MTTTLAPHAHKVMVRELSTGKLLEVFPVDAREYVATGGWALAGIAAPAAPAAEALTFIERLEAKSYKELQALAKQVGLDHMAKRSEIVAALLPHCEGGTVSLDAPGFAPPALTQFPAVK